MLFRSVTFIFLTRYIEDVLPTIISRSQCFFVPTQKPINYDYSAIDGIFTDYISFQRNDVFDISQNLQDLSKNIGTVNVLDGIQNYMLALLKSNPKRTDIIKHIEYVETAKQQANLGIKPVNLFDDLCLKIIN